MIQIVIELAEGTRAAESPEHCDEQAIVYQRCQVASQLNLKFESGEPWYHFRAFSQFH